MGFNSGFKGLNAAPSFGVTVGYEDVGVTLLLVCYQPTRMSSGWFGSDFYNIPLLF